MLAATTRHRGLSFWTTAAAALSLVRNSFASCANTTHCPEPCCRAATRAYAHRASASWRRAQCAAARSRATSACATKIIWPIALWVWRKREHRPNGNRFPSGFKIVLRNFSAYIRSPPRRPRPRHPVHILPTPPPSHAIIVSLNFEFLLPRSASSFSSLLTRFGRLPLTYIFPFIHTNRYSQTRPSIYITTLWRMPRIRCRILRYILQSIPTIYIM